MKKLIFLVFVIMILFFISGTVSSQNLPRIGIRGGIGTDINLGLAYGFGKSFSSGFDFRVELPVIVTFSAPGGASSVVPTLIATLGYRFKK